MRDPTWVEIHSRATAPPCCSIRGRVELRVLASDSGSVIGSHRASIAARWRGRGWPILFWHTIPNPAVSVCLTDASALVGGPPSEAELAFWRNKADRSGTYWARSDKTAARASVHASKEAAKPGPRTVRSGRGRPAWRSLGPSGLGSETAASLVRVIAHRATGGSARASTGRPSPPATRTFRSAP